MLGNLLRVEHRNFQHEYNDVQITLLHGLANNAGRFSLNVVSDELTVIQGRIFNSLFSWPLI